MLVVENIVSISVCSYGTYIQGIALVMDRDKYCIYSFEGLGAGISGVNGALLDKTYTRGYVYGVSDVADYNGLFLGASTNMAAHVQGGAWAPNGVYSEILGGMNTVPSVGCSITYYTTSQSNWIYGPAQYTVVTNPMPQSPMNITGRV